VIVLPCLSWPLSEKRHKNEERYCKKLFVKRNYPKFGRSLPTFEGITASFFSVGYNA
jgi:hypothetical protein